MLRGILVSVALGIAASGLAQPSLVEYPTETSTFFPPTPTGIASGPPGLVWFVNFNAAHSIGTATLDGDTTGSAQPPGDMATGAITGAPATYLWAGGSKNILKITRDPTPTFGITFALFPLPDASLVPLDRQHRLGRRVHGLVHGLRRRRQEARPARHDERVRPGERPFERLHEPGGLRQGHGQGLGWKYLVHVEHAVSARSWRTVPSSRSRCLPRPAGSPTARTAGSGSPNTRAPPISRRSTPATAPGCPARL